MISAQLEARLNEEKRIESIRRKERNESHLYMTMNVLLEDCFDGHQGHDLFDQEQVTLRAFRVKKSSTVEEIAVTLSETFVSFSDYDWTWNFLFAIQCIYAFFPSCISEMQYRTVENLAFCVEIKSNLQTDIVRFGN